MEIASHQASRLRRMLLASMPKCLVKANQKELNMQHSVHNRPIIRVADRTDVSGRVTADEVNLDRFHNRVRKICASLAGRSKVYLSAATMILIVTLVVPASAQKQVSFSGAIQGHEIDTPPAPNSTSGFGSATGIATHFGQLSFTYELMISPPNATGSAQLLIGANGDSIYTTVSGKLALTSTPGVASVMETYTIQGGTGRFVGVEGSFTLERLLDFGTGFTAGLFQGTITYPGEEDQE